MATRRGSTPLCDVPFLTRFGDALVEFHVTIVPREAPGALTPIRAVGFRAGGVVVARIIRACPRNRVASPSGKSIRALALETGSPQRLTSSAVGAWYFLAVIHLDFAIRALESVRTRARIAPRTCVCADTAIFTRRVVGTIVQIWNWKNKWGFNNSITINTLLRLHQMT